MGLYSGGLIIGRIFASEIWGAYFREGLFGGGGGGGLIIGILRYISKITQTRLFRQSYSLARSLSHSIRYLISFFVLLFYRVVPLFSTPTVNVQKMLSNSFMERYECVAFGWRFSFSLEYEPS